MPATDFNDLWEAITVIEAQEILTQLRIADWPNMKKSERTTFHRKLISKAYPGQVSGSVARSTEDIAKILGARLRNGRR